MTQITGSSLRPLGDGWRVYRRARSAAPAQCRRHARFEWRLHPRQSAGAACRL